MKAVSTGGNRYRTGHPAEAQLKEGQRSQLRQDVRDGSIDLLGSAPPNNTLDAPPNAGHPGPVDAIRSEEHTSELQSLRHLVCRLLLEKKNTLLVLCCPSRSPTCGAPHLAQFLLVCAPSVRATSDLLFDFLAPHAQHRVIVFFNDTATTEIYTLSLHDALPICSQPMKQILTRLALTLPVVWPVRSDRKSTRLNSSHLGISYAVFCLKKKKI